MEASLIQFWYPRVSIRSPPSCRYFMSHASVNFTRKTGLANIFTADSGSSFGEHILRIWGKKIMRSRFKSISRFLMRAKAFLCSPREKKQKTGKWGMEKEVLHSLLTQQECRLFPSR